MSLFNKIIENFQIGMLFFYNFPWKKLKFILNNIKTSKIIIQNLFNEPFQNNNFNNYLLNNSIFNKKTKVLQYLIRKGIKITNAQIISSVYQTNIETLPYLIPKDKKIEDLDEEVVNFIYFSCSKNIHLLKYFLDKHQLNLNIYELFKKICFTSIESNNINIIQYLIEEKKVDIQSYNENLIYLLLTNTQKNKNIIQYFISKEFNLEKVFEKLILYCSYTDNIEPVFYFIENIPSFNIRMNDDYFLRLAVKTGNVELIKLFENFQIDIINIYPNILIQAIYTRKIDFIKYLLDKQQINLKIDEEQIFKTAISLFCFTEEAKKEKLQIIQLLFNKGIDFNHKKYFFINEIVKKNEPEIIQYMIQHWLDFQTEQHQLFNLAVQNISFNTLKIIIDLGYDLLNEENNIPLIKLLKNYLLKNSDELNDFIQFILFDKNIQINEEVKNYLIVNNVNQYFLNQLEKREIFFDLTIDLNEKNKIEQKIYKKLKI